MPIANIKRPVDITSNETNEIRRWGKHIGDNIELINGKGGCSLRFSSTAVATATDNTPILFDTVRFSTGLVTLSADGTGIYCPKDGLVIGCYALFYETDVGGTYRGAAMVKNGVLTEMYGFFQHEQAGPISMAPTGTGIIPVSSGDVISLYAFQDKGSPVNLLEPSVHTHFDVHYIGVES